MNGFISVLALISWSPPVELNGVITDHSITIQTMDGDMIVYMNESIGASVSSVNQVVFLQPDVEYFATVTVTNGGGSTDASTPAVLSPQGSKDMRSPHFHSHFKIAGTSK